MIAAEQQRCVMILNMEQHSLWIIARMTQSFIAYARRQCHSWLGSSIRSPVFNAVRNEGPVSGLQLLLGLII
jgi:hypothetical protein